MMYGRYFVTSGAYSVRRIFSVNGPRASVAAGRGALRQNRQRPSPAADRPPSCEQFNTCSAYTYKITS